MRIPESVRAALLAAALWTALPVQAQARPAENRDVAASPVASEEREAQSKFIAHVQRALALKPGAAVADIGTGVSTEHPLHISRAIGDSGRLLCVDIDEKAIATLRGKLEESGIANVRTQVGKADDPMLAASSFDAVLVSYAYHHFAQPQALLAHIREALRPGGRLVIIEQISAKTRELPREDQVKHCELEPRILESELKTAGFESVNGVETLDVTKGEARYLIAARVAR